MNSKNKKQTNPFGFSWSVFKANTMELNAEIAAISALPDVGAEFFSAGWLSATWLDDSTESELRELILSKIPIIKSNEGEFGCFAIHSLNNDLERWNKLELTKCGPMFEDGLFSEDEVVAFACGFLGKHPYNFVATVTPKRSSHLNFVRKQLLKFLAPNPRWQVSIMHIINNLEPDEEVHLTIYNPLNFCGWLTDMYRDGSSNRIPQFEMSAKGGTTEVRYFGTLIWSGMVSKAKLRHVLKSVYPQESLVLMRAVNQWVNEYDDQIFRRFNLKHETFKQTADGVYWLNLRENPARWERSQMDLQSLQRFLVEHDHLVEAAGKYFEKHSTVI